MNTLRYSPYIQPFSTGVQWAVRLRAGDRCEACGIWLDGLGFFLPVVRHRPDAVPEEVMTSAANAVLLCSTCRDLARAPDPWMERLGFWIQGRADPRLTPMHIFCTTERTATVWRSVDGSYLVEPPTDYAAVL